MRAPRVWFLQLRQVALWLLLGVILGALMGRPLLGFGVASFLILSHWFYQLWRIQEWLSHPETEPPEGFGIWGDIFDRIYHLRTKERSAREELQATVNYLRDSFASMRDGTIMVDDRGVIQWSNEAASTLLGLRYPEDRGQGILNLVRLPEFHDYFVKGDYGQPLQVVIAGESELFLQIDITRFGGDNHLIFVRDVTTVTRMEHMRRDFVGNVSHELRTPLTVITGYLDTILANTENLDPRYQKPLEQMSQQSSRMENLLRDLLWLSRIESVHNPEEHVPVDMAVLLKDVRDEYAGNNPDREIVLSLDTDRRVLGDYRELHSAVGNLVQNAIKYSKSDSTVDISWQEDGLDSVLSVRDRGQGIAAVHLPRLTERFYRVDDSRSASTGGTGLGLAIVKHVAVGHGARLDIDSVPGVGSCFSLIFSQETQA